MFGMAVHERVGVGVGVGMWLRIPLSSIESPCMISSEK